MRVAHGCTHMADQLYCRLFLGFNVILKKNSVCVLLLDHQSLRQGFTQLFSPSYSMCKSGLKLKTVMVT